MPSTHTWQQQMRFNLRRQYARLLGMRLYLLSQWKTCVQAYDRSGNPSDSFFQIYLALIDCVAHEQQVDLNSLLEACARAASEEATSNLWQWHYPADHDLSDAYRESMLSDWVEMTDWLDEFLVEAQLGQSGDDMW